MTSSERAPTPALPVSALALARRLEVPYERVLRMIEAEEVATAGKMPGRTGAWLVPADEVERLVDERIAELDAARARLTGPGPGPGMTHGGGAS